MCSPLDLFLALTDPNCLITSNGIRYILFLKSKLTILDEGKKILCVKIYLKLYMNSFEISIINLELPIINLKIIEISWKLLCSFGNCYYWLYFYIFQNKLTQCSLIRPFLSLFLVAPSMSCEGMMTL